MPIKRSTQINNAKIDYSFIPIIKERNLSSYDTIRFIKKQFYKNHTIRKLKIGHAGTLDPFAAGLLIILFGHATKLNFLLNSLKKQYRAIAHFGEKKDTGDCTGTTVQRGFIPNKEDILKILPKFKGLIKQKPHLFSAVKINGKPAYKLA
ncbi:unnamed protein product, partial [marine sediment metagenome]